MESAWAHVRWIGGSPCCGKSTIAKQLAEEFNLNLYHCDEHWDKHVSDDSLSDTSLLRQLNQMSYEQIFMCSVDKQVATVIAAYQEEFPLILEDLKEFPTDQLLLVEGAALQPMLVTRFLSQSEYAIWMVPTESFQRETYVTRDWMHLIAEQTHNPELAIDNWMLRDARYARWIENQVECCHQMVVVVDGQQSIEYNKNIIQNRFRLRIDRY